MVLRICDREGYTFQRRVPLNKKLSLILVIISILAFTFASAFAPARVINISLISTSFLREKGVTFKFLATGDLRKTDFKGSVTVGGQSLKLYCNYSGDPAPTTVTCTSAKGTAARFAGKTGIVFVGGYSFVFTVPARP
jgi:hypothetical protein